MKKIFTLIVGISLISSLFAQTKTEIPVKVDLTQAEYLGKTPALKDLKDIPSTSKLKREKDKEKKGETVRNFENHDPGFQLKEGALPIGVDPVLQSNWNMAKTNSEEPTINIDGIDEYVGDVQPPDPNGDIGKDHYLQIVNASHYQIFDKDGNPLTAAISTNALWSSIGENSVGDPIILYDQEAERWLLTEIPFANKLLVAISETSDPGSAYDVYSFSTPGFPDYPKYGVWNNEYVITVNEGGNTEQPIYFINRDDLLNTELNPQMQRISFPGIEGAQSLQAAAPVDWMGDMNPPVNTNPMAVRYNDDAFGTLEDRLEIIEIDVDWIDPNNSSATQLNIPTAPFASFPCSAPGNGFECIPQLGGNGISGMEYFVMNSVRYRNFGTHEAIVLCFLVDIAPPSNHAGIRWMELRKTNSDWYLYQEGTFGAEDGVHRFMGSIAMDGRGNIALGYSRSGETMYAGLGYAGRRRSDPLGVMTIPEYVIVEGLSTNAVDRYGDYAAMTVDPENERTFWFTSEYMKAGGKWGTRIVSFEILSDTIDIGPTALLSPLTSGDLSSDEQVIVEVTNLGLDTVESFSVGYIFEGQSAIIDFVNYTLYPDSTYNHTFSSNVDLGNEGEYSFTIFTSLDGDSAFMNDTLETQIYHLLSEDVALSDISESQDVSCGGGASSIIVEITNNGSIDLDYATINILLNNTEINVYTLNMDSSLEYLETQLFTFNINDLVDGNNNVDVWVSYPNGNEDLNTSNDTLSTTLMANLSGVPIVLDLYTDEYGSETSWDLIEDSSGDTIYSEGGYPSSSLTSEEWCLTSGDCYTFIIYDAFGDGMCCNYGIGFYEIKDYQSSVITSTINQTWANSETNPFCVDTFMCNLSIETDAAPETTPAANDGAIYIEVTGGTSPFIYSIDGGVNYYPSNMFSDLEAGLYEVYVLDDNNCQAFASIAVAFCNISASIDVNNASASGASDGSINIDVSNGTDPFSYSLDNGNTTSPNAYFNGLSVGNYTVLVTDSFGCEYSDTVTVDFATIINNIKYTAQVRVYPNPTKELIQIAAPSEINYGTYLNIELIDIEGRMVRQASIPRFNLGYTGSMFLGDLPDGLYFLRLDSDTFTEMIRVIKQ